MGVVLVIFDGFGRGIGIADFRQGNMIWNIGISHYIICLWLVEKLNNIERNT